MRGRIDTTKGKNFCGLQEVYTNNQLQTHILTQPHPWHRHPDRHHRNKHHQPRRLMCKHRAMQTRKPHHRVLPQPRHYRTHEAPRDERGHAEEPDFESAELKPHHLSCHAVEDCWAAGWQVGREGGGEEHKAGVEDGEPGGGGEDGDEGQLRGWGVSVSVFFFGNEGFVEEA